MNVKTNVEEGTKDIVAMAEMKTMDFNYKKRGF
jgi:hypothetical protein